MVFQMRVTISDPDHYASLNPCIYNYIPLRYANPEPTLSGKPLKYHAIWRNTFYIHEPHHIGTKPEMWAPSILAV
jgi:hypothetical protein